MHDIRICGNFYKSSRGMKGHLITNFPNVIVLGGVYMEESQPSGRASTTKRAGFHLAFTWEKPALLPGLARLAESPWLTTFIFRQNRESDICVQVFIL